MSDTNNPEPNEPLEPAGPSPGSTSSPDVTVGSEGPVASPQETPAPPPASPAEPTPDWRDKRIATLTRRLRELQEKGATPPALPPSAEPPARPYQPPTDLDALVNQRAREMAVITDFNRRCDETAALGRSTFGEVEFNSRIDNLRKLVDNTDIQSVQTYNSMLTAALDTGDAAKVLYDLGADLNEAQRILSLSPTKMAVELTRKASMPAAQVSNAPKPITPITSRGPSNERISPDDPDRSDGLGTAEWMRRREAQVAERRNANR